MKKRIQSSSSLTLLHFDCCVKTPSRLLIRWGFLRHKKRGTHLDPPQASALDIAKHLNVGHHIRDTIILPNLPGRIHFVVCILLSVFCATWVPRFDKCISFHSNQQPQFGFSCVQTPPRFDT